MFLTWSIVVPRPALSPQKSAVKMPELKPTAAIAMKVRIGTTLAIVTTTLTAAAFLTPLRVRKWTSHSRTEAPTIATVVVPPSKPAEPVAQRGHQQHEVGDVADPGADPVAPRGGEADVLTEAGARVAVDAAVDVGLALRECLEHEGEHQHADPGDQPADEEWTGGRAPGHLGGQGEDAAPDHGAHHQGGEGGQCQPDHRTTFGRLRRYRDSASSLEQSSAASFVGRRQESPALLPRLLLAVRPGQGRTSPVTGSFDTPPGFEIEPRDP